MLAQLHLWLSSYVPAGVGLCFLGFVLGYPVGRRVFRGPAGPLFALLLGLAMLSLVVCALSWVGVFSRWSVGVVAVIAAGVTVWGLRSDLPKWWSRRHVPSAGTTLWFLTLVGAVLYFSVLAIYPSTAFDSTSYHLPLAHTGGVPRTGLRPLYTLQFLSAGKRVGVCGDAAHHLSAIRGLGRV